MTERYLRKTAKEIFWLSILGIPYLIWMYSIGIELNKKIPKNRRLNRFLFIGLSIYPIVYTCIIFPLFITKTLNINSIMTCHIGAMLCVFLLMILTTITIIRFEQSEKLKKSNGIKVFFMLWYFIFGVWYLQPKLNEYIKRIK